MTAKKQGKAKKFETALASMFTDITDGRLAKETLRESVEIYRSILKASPDAITTTDLDGHILMVSPAALTMFGYEREDELAGHLVTDFIFPEDRDKALSNIALMLQGIMTGPGEYRGLRADGSTFEIEANGELIRGADGQPTNIIFVIRDITGRKRAEKELRKSEELFKSMVHNSDDLTILTDDKGIVIYLSPQCESILGYPSDKFIGQTMPDIIYPDDFAKCQLAWEQVFHHGQELRDFEYRIIDGKQEVRWISHSARLVKVDGKVLGMQNTIRNITKRKQGMRALRESEERHRTILQTAMDGFWLVDMQGRLLEVNDAYCRMSGYSEQELLAMSIPDLEVTESAADTAAHIQKIIAQGEDRFESRHRRKDRSIFTVEISVKYRPVKGGLFAGFMRDITERKRLEDVLRMSEEKYRSLVDNSNESILVAQDGLLKFVNNRTSELTGYSEQELTAMPFSEFIHPDDRDMVVGNYLSRIKGEALQPKYEFRITTRDGVVKWVEINAVMIEWESKPATLNFISDVSERKRTEEALRESEDKYRTIVEQSVMGIGISKGNQIIFANKALLRMLNYDDLEEFKKIPLLDHVAPSSRQLITERMTMIAEGEIPPPEYEYDIISKGGLIRTFLASNIRLSLGKEFYIQSTFQDITERKRAEEARERTHNEMENLLNNLTDAIFSVDAVKNTMMIVSPAHQTVFGYPPSEFFKNPQLWYEQVIPEDKPIIDAGYPVLFAGNNLQHQVRIVHPDGQIRWIEARLRPTLDIEGKLVRVDGIVADITERKRIEEALRASEERFRKVFERAHLGIVITSPSFKFEKVNPAFCRLMGYSADELISMTFADITHPDYLKKDMENVKKVGRGEIPFYQTEKRYIKKNGDVLWGNLIVSSIRDEHGALQYYLSMVNDITERKIAEEALREVNQRFEAHISNSPLAVIEFDPQFRVVKWSGAAERIFGWSQDEILGKAITEMPWVFEEDMESVQQVSEDMLTARRPSNLNINRNYTKNGSIIQCEWYNSAIYDEQGQMRSILSLVLDITERKWAERRQLLSAEILGILNEDIAFSDAVKNILIAIKQETGFDAVGIRLRTGDDFPYFVQNGFSEDFLRTENTLIVREKGGDVCRDENGNISLECTCGLVLSGKTDPSNPLCTPGGSFWTNDSIPLLDLMADQDPRLHPRNRCIHEGFQSVALIPIRVKEEIVGLLQLNDRKKGRLTLDRIRFFEGISESIGIAIMRKQSEDALRESEERLRLAQKATNDVIWDWNIVNDQQMWNESGAVVFGWTDIVTVPQTAAWWVEKVHPEDRQRVDDGFFTVINNPTESRWQDEYRFLKSDGSYAHVVDRGYVIRDTQGKAVRMIGAMLDITERKKAEELLFLSKQKLEQHVKQTLFAVIEWDIDFRVREWNTAAQQIFGYTKEEALGQHASFIISESAREHVDAVWQALLVQKGGRRSMNMNIRKDSQIISCDWFNTPLTDTQGKTTGVISLAMDVTAKIQAEDALKKSEIRYHELFSNISSGVAIYEARDNGNDFIFKDMNKAGERIDNDRRENVLDKSVLEVRPGINEFGLLDVFKRVWKTGIPEYLPVSLYHDERLTKWYENFVYKLPTGEIVAVYDDVTERKKSEDALRESEERFQQLFDHMADGVAVYQAVDEGQDFVIVDINKTGQSLSHVRLDEAVGRRVTEVFPGVERIGLLDVFRRVWRTGRPEHHPLTEYKDGRIKEWVENYVYKLPSGLIVAIYEDTSEKHRAEELLRESEERLDSIVRTIPDIIYRLDSEGKIVFVNSAVEQYGYTTDELIGRDILDFVCPRDREKASYRLNERRTGDRHTKSFEIRLMRKDQVCIEFDIKSDIVSSMPVFSVDAEGIYIAQGTKNQVFLGTQGIARDITDRKHYEEEKAKLEAQLAHAQKMESIGLLAGGIAHDFNNILSIILGFAQIAKEDTIPPGSSIIESLDEIEKAGLRASDLVKQILAFSRKSQTERQPFKVGLVIKECIKMLRASLPSTIDIKYTDTSSSDLILAGPAQIEQIVMNLSTNASHAMRDKGGVLKVTLEDVVFDTNNITLYPGLVPGEYSKITFSDTGYGMDPQILPHVFEPYFTTKKKGEGTGLGLSVVYGIVKSLGGNISVSSTIGVGTTFEILIPKYLKKEITTEEKPALFKGGRESILVVDDESQIVDIEMKMLKNLGYYVTGFTKSEDALGFFTANSGSFDVVITDQTMPMMTGDELAAELLTICPDLPIILCTGHSDRIDEKYISKIGIKALLFKPVTVANLAKTIRKVLDDE
ncbi:PAS domain S-box protein [bacterium]|nr:PAS domain S-box protein [bacterium]